MNLASVFLTMATTALAHFSMYDKSIFDCTPDDNGSNVFKPLQDMDFDEWWFHGNLDCPPKLGQSGTWKELPANGKVLIAMAGGRNQVSEKYRFHRGGPGFRKDIVFEKYSGTGKCKKNCKNLAELTDTPGGFNGWYPRQPRQIDWTGTYKDRKAVNGTTVDNGWAGHNYGNIHAFQRKAVAGCALGIAYKSDPQEVGQKDFVLFSVVHDCPRNQLQWFDIPNLPSCPLDECICGWFWIHKSTSGTTQMYMTAFQCTVTGAKPDAQKIDYARALPPRRCYNPKDCFFGPRLPMYWRNNEPDGRNNMPEDQDRAPTYSIMYGFREGAQHDIFVNTNPRPRNKNIPDEAKCNIDNKRSRLNYGEKLLSGEKLRSPDCNIEFTLRQNGQLRIKELYVNEPDKRERILWETEDPETAGPFQLYISTNGELRLTTQEEEGIWGGRVLYSSTDWFPEDAGIDREYHLDMTNYGHLVLFDGTGIDLWESPYTDKFPIYFWPTEPDPPEWETMGGGSLSPQPTSGPSPTPYQTPAAKCASEAETCTCNGTVYFGRRYVSDGSGQEVSSVEQLKTSAFKMWVQNGPQACSNDRQGDPLEGVPKQCLCQEEESTETTWNFETGDLSGWTTTGTAFTFQPTFGDNSAARNKEKPSNLEGNHYVGTYEKYQRGTDTKAGDIQGDEEWGTMTSREFTVSTSSISFLIGGGNDINNLYVGLKVDGQVVKSDTGENKEFMELKKWDVSAYLGRQAQIEVVDMGTGDWDHINVDDFKFFDESGFTEVEERSEGGLLTGKVSKLKSKVLQRNAVQHSLVE